MNTITSDPWQPGEHTGPRPAYPPCRPVHTVMRILAADGCEKISVTAENSGQAVEAASAPLVRPRRHSRPGGALTRPATKPSADQRRAVERAHELAEATAFYLGRRERTRARPGQIEPRQVRPEEPASVVAATLPLADYGQDEELTDERPARRADRTRLLADQLSGADLLRRPA